jgi:RNA-binding protein PNO1
MPAPTALKARPEEAPSELVPDARTDSHEQDLDMTLEDPTLLSPESKLPSSEAVDLEMQVDTESRPLFTASKAVTTKLRSETRKVPIPPHRFTPLKNNWTKIYPPLVKHLKLEVRMNLRPKNRCVEMRVGKNTTDAGALQKGEDFVKAFALGFDVDDSIALLRLDELYLESFEIKDVRTLHGEHLSRAIGRIAGKDGKTRFSIENATKTRIVLADSKIHILGAFQNIRMARETVVSLILGQPPSKIYHNLRVMSARMKERY